MESLGGGPAAPPRKPGQEGDLRRLESIREDITFLIHETRTPLTAIMGAAELLKYPCSAEQHAFLVQMIESEARRINALFFDFFEAYQRDGASWLADLHPSLLDIAELVQEAVSRFSNLGEKYSLQTSVAPNLPTICADRDKVTLVLRNLLANAVKFSPDGGKISISAERNANFVIICVRDEGIGIPEADLQSIFQTSFRGNSPGNQGTRGAGLGLAIVDRIVESHGGQVQVESQCGAGSTFCVWLPIDAP